MPINNLAILNMKNFLPRLTLKMQIELMPAYKIKYVVTRFLINGRVNWGSIIIIN